MSKLRHNRADRESPNPRPLACIAWLLLAFVLLHFMKESIQIYNPADPSTQYSILGMMSLPYTVPPSQHSQSTLPPSSFFHTYEEGEEMDMVPDSHFRDMPHQYQFMARFQDCELRRHASPLTTPVTMRRSSAALFIKDSNCVTIRIVMPSSFGFCSWRCYEAMIETTAVGIYLYASFVLTSLLFLNADKAIEYATVMVICLSIVRILVLLF